MPINQPARRLWTEFCAKHEIASTAVPLFDCDGALRVSIKTVGRALQRPVLRRSSEMEKLVISQTDLLVQDWEQQSFAYDGLIYMMFRKEKNVAGKNVVVPLYIGKTETIGRRGDLSANIRNLARDKSKFARWGDNYAYHIGDLSAVVLPGHAPQKQTDKYKSWAEALFRESPAAAPRLRKPVYFWTTAWKPTSVGIWEEFGETRLTFLEYLLIGVASAAFPDSQLNREGQNRFV